jgi:hypothetical protein
MPGTLGGLVDNPYGKGQSIGGTNGDAGTAVVALLAEIIALWLQSEFAHGIAFSTVVAALHRALYAD